jgi:hypothetical protein
LLGAASRWAESASEEIAMSTILRSNGGYILIAISAFLFLFPAALPPDLRFVLGITCVPAALVFLLLKLSGES